MALKSKAIVNVEARQTQASDLGEGVGSLVKSYGTQFADGTGAGQANVIFHDQRTLAASALDQLDLSGTLAGTFGNVTFARVKAIIVKAADGNTNDVTIGGGNFATWAGTGTDLVKIRPGGTFALTVGSADATGYAVTATTADILRISNAAGGTSVTYDVIVIGASA
jgi:hypothetical protein